MRISGAIARNVPKHPKKGVFWAVLGFVGPYLELHLAKSTHPSANR